MTSRLLVLTVVFGLTAGYVGFAMTPERVPLRAPFSSMAPEAGRWKLVSSPAIDDKILAVLGVDDYISRVYRASASEFASLYVGYYQSQREGDTMHSPMNCLPGAGWQPTETSFVQISIAGRPRPIEVKHVVIEKGLERQVVLYWYQSHGRVMGSEYWSKVTMVYDAFRLNRSDAALVRVITPIPQTDTGLQSATPLAIDFVQAVFPQLEAHLPS